MMGILGNLGWIDLLDIVVVAVVVYRLLLLLRGSAALRLLLLLLLLLLAYFASGPAGLRTLHWLSGNLLGSVALILVIIFQHDIRRAIMTPGRRRTLPSQGQEELPELVEELVLAAEALSARRIGALIVVERDMPVDGVIQVGTQIDAKVSSEIITSIFLPYSPIHDGAVIIQKGKLTKAGCLLPLSHNPEISKSLGTRHRAAIGLTELVDALVIVVSEETGSVSVVIGGRINRGLDAAAVGKVLKKSLDARWLG